MTKPDDRDPWARFRVVSLVLDPPAITVLSGLPPSSSHVSGELLSRRAPHVWNDNEWAIVSTVFVSSADPAVHVEALLDFVESRKGVLARLRSRESQTMLETNWGEVMSKGRPTLSRGQQARSSALPIDHYADHHFFWGTGGHPSGS